MLKSYKWMVGWDGLGISVSTSYKSTFVANNCLIGHTCEQYFNKKSAIEGFSLVYQLQVAHPAVQVLRTSTAKVTINFMGES